jgi:hypothetical protein
VTAALAGAGAKNCRGEMTRRITTVHISTLGPF